MAEGYETRRIKENLLKKQPYELLVQLGGALAILLAFVTYVLPIFQTTPLKWPAAATMTALFTDFILGGALILTGAIMTKNLINGAIVAGIVSVILIAFGGQSGTIGGIVGILGAVVAVASPYLPKQRH